MILRGLEGACHPFKRPLLYVATKNQVRAPPSEAREQARELYVQVRRTVQVLSRCLELPLE